MYASGLEMSPTDSERIDALEEKVAYLDRLVAELTAGRPIVFQPQPVDPIDPPLGSERDGLYLEAEGPTA